MSSQSAISAERHEAATASAGARARATYGDKDLSGALEEMRRGLLAYRIYWALANSEIRARYRRSFFGPLWMTLASAVTVLGLGFLWARLWNAPIADYFPYLAAGLITWNYIAAVLIECPNVFVTQQNLLKSSTMSLFVYPMRAAIKQFILAIHQIPVLVAVFLIFGRDLYATAPLCLVGFALIFLNSIWVFSLVGMVGARMRDISFMIEAAVPLAFFMTPVLWRAEDFGVGHPVIAFNPFAHAIALVRDPVLGAVPDPASYGVMIGLAVVGWGLAIWAFRYRHRIAFWVQ
jgi:lipopolysaccharide transport system permease protein